MRLLDIVNQSQRTFSEAKNAIRYPLQTAQRFLSRRFVRFYESLNLPIDREGSGQEAEKSLRTSNSEERHRSVKSEPQAKQVDESQQPMAIDSPATAAMNDSSPQSVEESLPLLMAGSELQGRWWGNYTVVSLLQEEPWVRLYDGQNTKIKEPVWIYEYLLYESGFQHQTRNSFQEHRTRAFLTLIDQNLRLGGDSDFRIVKPKSPPNRRF